MWTLWDKFISFTSLLPKRAEFSAAFPIISISYSCTLWMQQHGSKEIRRRQINSPVSLWMTSILGSSAPQELRPVPMFSASGGSSMSLFQSFSLFVNLMPLVSLQSALHVPCLCQHLMRSNDVHLTLLRKDRAGHWACALRKTSGLSLHTYSRC